MGNFNLTKLAVNRCCPGNVAQLDDAGLPSLMVWIPAFKLSDVLNTDNESIHPAFIVNGVQIPGFWYSKYENVAHEGKVYSLPGETPQANFTLDVAKQYCEAKGYGWHLSTNAEWAAIALLCAKNGTQPNGNTKYGKDSGETEYKAIPASYDDSGRITAVATGTGPLTWSHDRTMSGVWDMSGNLFEWQGGLRMVWGEIQVLADTDAADPDNPQNASSVCWKAINAADGSLVEPECKTTDTSAKLSGSTVRLDFVNNAWVYVTTITSSETPTRGCRFAAMSCADNISAAAKLRLQSLLILPDDGKDYGGDYFWANNGVEERCSYRGGGFSNGTDGGVFSVYFGPRTSSGNSLGCRAAYIPNI